MPIPANSCQFLPIPALAVAFLFLSWCYDGNLRLVSPRDISHLVLVIGMMRIRAACSLRQSAVAQLLDFWLSHC